MTERTVTKTRTRGSATNHVFVYRETDSGVELMGRFTPSDSKSPRRAAMAYIAALANNPSFQKDISEGRIFTLSGHPERIEIVSEPRVRIGK